MGKSLLDIAKEVIQTEADSVGALKERIDQNFIDVCHTLKSCMGKVVLIGMGKSGHIAKKSLQLLHPQGLLLSTCIPERRVMVT